MFKDDDDIHDNEKMEFSYLSQQGAGANPEKVTKRQDKAWKHIHAQIPHHEWERRFEQLMKLSLIDVPSDYYRDELFFTKPQELMEIFQKLEDDNLSKIHEQQEMAVIYEALL